MQTREELQNGRQAQAFLCKGLLEATRSMSALSMQWGQHNIRVITVIIWRMTQLLSSAQINQQERTMEIGEGEIKNGISEIKIEISEMGWEMPLSARSSEVNLAELVVRKWMKNHLFPYQRCWINITLDRSPL